LTPVCPPPPYSLESGFKDRPPSVALEETQVRLSVITDEISDDIAYALDVCASLGVERAEIRSMAGRNLVDHPPEAWHRVAGLLGAGGFACPVFDSPFLKETPVPGDDDFGGVDWAVLDRAIEIAGVLGASTVRVFSGRRRGAGIGAPDPGLLDWLADVLAETADRAAWTGLDIAVEIEHACTLGTAAEAAALSTEDGGWGFVLDPGNESYLTGRPADVELVSALAPRIRHVHVKDVDAGQAWIRVGDGLVGWPDQLAALRGNGYAGHLSMETHYATGPAGAETATRESVAALRTLASAAGIELR
jgi:L-ribulose-5-phosphate 3-epimerase